MDKPAARQDEKHHLDGATSQSSVKAQDEKAVRASMREAEEMGLGATPALFVNGYKLEGAEPIDRVRAVFDLALQDAGAAPPEHKITAAANPPPGKPST